MFDFDKLYQNMLKRQQESLASEPPAQSEDDSVSSLSDEEEESGAMHLWLTSSNEILLKAISSLMTECCTPAQLSTPARIEKQHRVFEALTLGLYCSYEGNSDKWRGISLNRNDWYGSGRYASLNLSGKYLVKAITSLHEHGYIDRRLGNYAQKKQTIIRATDKLAKHIEQPDGSVTNLATAISSDKARYLVRPEKPFIVFKNGKGVVIHKDEFPEHVLERKQLLESYHQLLYSHEIELNGRLLTMPEKTQYCIFTKRWDLHGRFYGGAWKECLKEQRPSIKIDGEETIEFDIKSCHCAMLYHSAGIDIWATGAEDLYNLTPFTEHPTFGKGIRRFLKYVFMYAINNNPTPKQWYNFKKSIERHFEREEYSTELREFIREHQSDIVHGFLDVRHKDISHYFFSRRDLGKELFFKDSTIAHHMIKMLTDNGIITLTLHDSYIVKKSQSEELLYLLPKVYEVICGYRPSF